MRIAISVVTVSALLAVLCQPARGQGVLKMEHELAVSPDDFLPLGNSSDSPEKAPTTRKGLMIAGWATLGGGYMFTALVGLLLLQKGLEADSNPAIECLNCDTAGPLMLVPLVGPFIAIPHADGVDGKVVSGILGGVQVAGLVMGIIGTIMFSADRKKYKAWKHGRVALSDDWYLSSGVASTNLADGQELTPMVQLGASF